MGELTNESLKTNHNRRAKKMQVGFFMSPGSSPELQRRLSSPGGIIFKSMEGYILIWRKILETSFYKNSYSLHLALHLLMKANHQDKKIVFNGEEIEIKRGQVIVGRKALALETGISEGTIYDKLKILKKCDFLNIKSNNKFSIITLLNYNSYQNPNNKSNIKSNNQPTTNQQPTNTNKECKECNNDKEKKKNVFSFDEIYLKYPKRVGRKEAARHFEASVKTDQDWLDIQTALKNYIGSERVAKGFIQNASTWFNNWKDWINFKESNLSAAEEAHNIFFKKESK